MYFAYGETELAYLRKKDKRLCEVIDRLGHIDRAVDTDLFFFRRSPHHRPADLHQGPGDDLEPLPGCAGDINAETILSAGVPKLQSLGMTFRKAEYITDFAEKVRSGAFDIGAVEQMPDAELFRPSAA